MRNNRFFFKHFSVLFLLSLLLGSCFHPSGPEDFTEYDDENVGTANDPIIIKNEKQLRSLAKNVNNGFNGYEGMYFLANDISLGKENWTPIGTPSHPFKGNFDGGGYSISGMKVNTANQRAGLFGYIEGGTIKNLVLKNGSVTNTFSDSYYYSMSGAIAAYIKNGKIQFCGNESVTVSATAQKSLSGGIVGYAENSTIFNCYNNATVKASQSTSYSIAGSIIGSLASSQFSYQSWTTGADGYPVLDF